jgi:hypothetical protein
LEVHLIRGIQYDHDEGKAISGGFVYDGLAVPSLRDKCIFADITNGRFFVTEGNLLANGQQPSIKELEIYVDNKRITFQEVNGTDKPDPRIGLGPGGELFIFTKADGNLYKVISYTSHP